MTLRHPGPVQAVIPLLAEIRDRFLITVLATDAALPFLYERYGTMLTGMTVYRRQDGRWIPADRETCGMQDGSEFPSREHEGYCALTASLAELLRRLRPDVLLRTTPAIHYGVDEAAVEAVLSEKLPCRLLCYQEYYGCGKALEDFPGTILTVDEEASALLERRGIASEPVGWLSRLDLLRYPDIARARAEARASLSLSEEDVALLYCATASGAFDAELGIFSDLVSHVGQARLFLKLHPRNTESERQRYLSLLPEGGVCLEQGLPYSALLAFPDLILSPASAVNVDALSYRAAFPLSAPGMISMYTRGERTRTIVKQATDLDELPPGMPGHGSLILAEDLAGSRFEKPNRGTADALLREAETFLGGPTDTMVERVLLYLMKGE